MSKRTARQARSRNAKGKPKEVVIEDTGNKVVAESVVEVEVEEDVPSCLTCIEDITYFAVGNACDHKELCARCLLRQRKLYGRPECVLCQATHTKIVITKDNTKSFSDFDTASLPNMPEIQIFFETRKIFNVFDALFKFTCQKCNHAFESLSNLKSHLKDKHTLMYCDVCLDHVQNFLEEYELFSPNQLEKHVQGVGKQNDGHAYCKFCKDAFFDEDTLWMHKYNKHTHCRVCAKQNDDYLFFANYKSLLGHYKSRHYICKDPVCVASKHVVFESAVELQEHMIISHTSAENYKSRSELKQARTLQLDFEFAAPTSHWRGRNGSQRDQRNRKQQEERFEEWPEEPSFTPTAQNSNEKKKEKKKEKKNDTKQEKPEDILSIELPPLPTSNEELKNRNRALIKVIRASLLKDDYFGSFRQLNIDYVNGNELSAEQFHRESIKLFQKDSVHSILMELMSLLPDVKKRVDLKNVHEFWFLDQQKKRKQEKDKQKQKQTQKEKKEQSNKQKDQSGKPKQQNKKSNKPKSKNGVWNVPEQPVQPEKKPEPKKVVNTEAESPDTLLSAPRNVPQETPLTSSAEFPSLNGDGSSLPPGLFSAGAYADRLQGKYSAEDFPTLQSGIPNTAPTPAQQQQKEWKQPNSSNKKKKKQQRKKNVLFTVG